MIRTFTTAIALAAFMIGAAATTTFAAGSSEKMADCAKIKDTQERAACIEQQKGKK